MVLPRNRLICFTGVSGSGKSSLAFDTLYAEGQRRYIESLSSYARRFLDPLPKPDVEMISGLGPAIAISQSNTATNPRSTVGTLTEIYDYLRLLFARVATPHCPDCGCRVGAQSVEEIVARLTQLTPGSTYGILAPISSERRGEFKWLFENLRRRGFARVRVDGRWFSLSREPALNRRMRHEIEVLVDRFDPGKIEEGKLAETVRFALQTGGGSIVVVPYDPSQIAEDGLPADGGVSGALTPTGSFLSSSLGSRAHAGLERSPQETVLAESGELRFATEFVCPRCRKSYEPLTPGQFSFNTTKGMCSICHGLGSVESLDPAKIIPDPSRSIQQGAIQPLGRWNQMNEYIRATLLAWARSLEKRFQLDQGIILETAWEELPRELKRILLWGESRREDEGGTEERAATSLLEIAGILTLVRVFCPLPQEQLQELYGGHVVCPGCHGERLKPWARAALLRTRSTAYTGRQQLNLPQLCQLPIVEAAEFLRVLDLEPTAEKIAEPILREILLRLKFVIDIGLGYLTLDRPTPSLAGGELQRIRLASQLGSGLTGVLYVLDEPSIGQHPRDTGRLLESLRRLRDQGNTVVVVEHDEQTIRAADFVADFGPGAGGHGGRIVAAGTLEDIRRCEESITGKFLSGQRQIPLPQQRRAPGPERLIIRGAKFNNLKQIDVEIPLGLFVCVTGVSGSGKSSLVSDVLLQELQKALARKGYQPSRCQALEGVDQLTRVINVDQSPIGRSPRSNPATYTKLFDHIRGFFAQLPEAKIRGFKPGRFSFNVAGGRCEACGGNGAWKLDMDFLADIWITCNLCGGKRFNQETLAVRYRGKSIADVLDMDVTEALEHFAKLPEIHRQLQVLQDVGLGYVKLGQPSPTLSGGEAQRVKLARELVKKPRGHTLYVFDEPTTGLHFADVERLLRLLHGLVSAGNTVLVIEHNLDVIKTADWVIDLGPEAGEAGGYLVACGTPEEVAKVPQSHTGQALREVLNKAVAQLSTFGNGSRKGTETGKAVGIASGNGGGKELGSSTGDHRGDTDRASHPNEARDEAEACRSEFPSVSQKLSEVFAPGTITVRGARQHNLKNIDVDIPRDALTVFCGPSGSGKTSLAMDTIYAEGRRRYVDSLNTYARQFIGQLPKPEVDHIEGLSPAIAVEQKHGSYSPRSTVGSATEIYDYLRILMARLGTQYCPACQEPTGAQTRDEIVEQLLMRPAGVWLYLLAPLESLPGETVTKVLSIVRSSGYTRVVIDGKIYPVDELAKLRAFEKHEVQIVVDRVRLQPELRSRLAGSVEAALQLGRGLLRVAEASPEKPEVLGPVAVYSQLSACRRCGRSFPVLSVHHFSFNSPLGWCRACEGLGTQCGVNLAAVICDPRISLRQGAMRFLPAPRSALAATILETLGREAGLPIDLPWEQLAAVHRRTVLHGTGERWFEVSQEVPSGEEAGTTERKPPLRFRFRGVVEALDQAAKGSQALRESLVRWIDTGECFECGGSRLREEVLCVRWKGRTIDDLCRQNLTDLAHWFEACELSELEEKIAGGIVGEIRARLRFLVDLGLGYLNLARPTQSLSGGEMQRIRLAAQLGSGLSGVLYVLDEPTVGLHPHDTRRLTAAMNRLRDLGNTVLVVEHDRQVVAGADHVLDFGPGAGKDGGQIVSQGKPATVAEDPWSKTGPYLSGFKAIPIPTVRRMTAKLAESRELYSPQQPGRDATSADSCGRQMRKPKRKASSAPSTAGETRREPTPPGGLWLEIIGARHHNLKNISVRIPLGALTVITGKSGSGKSTLIDDILYPALTQRLRGPTAHKPGVHKAILGDVAIDKVIRVEQRFFASQTHSCPATYTGVFDLIRSEFATLPEAAKNRLTPGLFSFNVPGGRCERCEGAGRIFVQMHFLPDIWVECPECEGKRFSRRILAIRYRGHNIAEVLEMSAAEALPVFGDKPPIARILQTLCDVGLDYLPLGQPATELSGGEAQRLQLTAELARPQTGRTLYLLDEPTTGLHFDDLAKLIRILHRLVELGNTVVVVEHNLDLIKVADWVIDLGPEGGDAGGYVVAEGTPEDIVAHARRFWRGSKVPVSAPVGNREMNSHVMVPAGLDGELVRVHDGQLLLRSFTGEELEPVLRAGPWADLSRLRESDFSAEESQVKPLIDARVLTSDATGRALAEQGVGTSRAVPQIEQGVGITRGVRQVEKKQQQQAKEEITAKERESLRSGTGQSGRNEGADEGVPSNWPPLFRVITRVAEETGLRAIRYDGERKYLEISGPNESRELFAWVDFSNPAVARCRLRTSLPGKAFEQWLRKLVKLGEIREVRKSDDLIGEFDATHPEELCSRGHGENVSDDGGLTTFRDSLATNCGDQIAITFRDDKSGEVEFCLPADWSRVSKLEVLLRAAAIGYRANTLARIRGSKTRPTLTPSERKGQ